MKQKEYMVRVWGGAFNKNASPSIEKELGIKKGCYYFYDSDKKDAFLKLINDPVYKKQGIGLDIRYGYMTHKRTIFVGTFKYKDKEFILHYDFGYDYPEDEAIFMFTTGNYSCDCNRSIFIRSEYGDNSMPELGCGYEIKLVDYHFEYLDLEEETYELLR